MSNTNNKDVVIAMLDIVKWVVPFLILAIVFGQPISTLADRVAKHANNVELPGFKVQLEQEFANQTDPRYIVAVSKLKSDDLERFIKVSRPSKNFLGHTLASFSEDKLYVNQELYSKTISKLNSLGLVELSRSEANLASLIAQHNLPLLDENDTYIVYDGMSVSNDIRPSFDTYLKMTSFGEDLVEAIFNKIETAWR